MHDPMHEPGGAGTFAFRVRAFSFGRRVLTCALAVVLLGITPPVARAQDAAPAKAVPAKKAPAKKAAPAKAAPKTKAAAKPKAAAKAAPKGKAVAKAPAKRPTAKPLPATAKAPPIPRREPFTMSQKDRDIFTEAMRAVEARQWSRAKDVVSRSQTPILHKMIDWAYIREPGNHVGFGERTAFIANNPGWPGLQTIQRRAEEALDENITVTVPVVVVDWFAAHPPLTASGRSAYARALQIMGRGAEAVPIARAAWRTSTFSGGTERAFLEAFGSVITPEDERERLDRLLYDEEAVLAERQIARVDATTASIARARIGLMKAAGNIDALIAAVPPAYQEDPGLIYDRVKWRRKQDKLDAAHELLPNHPDRGTRPDLMWKERQILARDALNNGLISQAYTIVKNHGEIDAANGLADAEWMAGWIALRFLKDGEAALVHFEKVYDSVQVPANVARGAYWTGRAAEFLGRADIANDWYRRGATYVTTYYGQLALSRLKEDPIPMLSDEPTPTVADQNAFEERELTQATRALADIHNKNYLRTFVMALADSTGDLVQRHLAGQLADRLGHPDWAVSVAREAARDGIPLLTYGYPVPHYPVPATPERALVLGIARQESNFDPNAQSVVGALGLMQLMPATAKGLAKREKINYVQSKLTSDPAYNLRLGSAFLESLVESFDGSYILAAAAYNAGPGRARQWSRTFGDPRDGQTDPVDWVEQIPFAETRAYVQRVMENVMIYRARLNQTRVIGATLEKELVRAKPAG